MMIIIKSVYGDDNSNDGLYSINIPTKHEINYKKIISKVGNILDSIRNECIDSPNDVEYNDCVLTLEDVTRMWDKFLDEVFEGASLSSILNIIGWEYTKINPTEVFDADYNEFM